MDEMAIVEEQVLQLFAQQHAEASDHRKLQLAQTQRMEMFQVWLQQTGTDSDKSGIVGADSKYLTIFRYEN